MLLASDVGNTNIALGLFRDEHLEAHFRLHTDIQATTDEYSLLVDGLLRHAGYGPDDVTGGVLASVVPRLTSIFMEVLAGLAGHPPLVIDAGVKTGVPVRYDSPRDVGADRVANAVAVQHEYGVPACVIDFGTSTTFDAVNSLGEYVGGAIAPGLEISLEALVSRTAKLQNVELRRPPSVIGSNTPNAIQSGWVFGYVGLVEGMVARFRRELGESMIVVGTGGLVSVVADETTVIDHVDTTLTLKGLRLLHERNPERRRD
jgi:type III pantothenate kinase